jgi:signal transduction histidine kinase
VIRAIIKADLRILLAALWTLFTLALVCWWWIFVAFTPLSMESAAKAQRMFLYEGSCLVPVVVAGGIALLLLTWRDRRRHQQLKLFFANFSHDIKTGITRLRLQSEILQESHPPQDFPSLHLLVSDIARLDLHLENALYLANMEEGLLLMEDLRLSRLLEALRPEWSEVQFVLRGDEAFCSDKRALLSVLRNLCANAVLHGQASSIEFKARRLGAQVELEVSSNGRPFTGDLAALGRGPLASSNGSGHGLGLYLSAALAARLGGSLRFGRSAAGQLTASITLPAARA